MAYFNHAFTKAFVGTTGFLTDGTLTQDLALGEFGFINPAESGTETHNAVVNPTALTCPLVLVAGSLYQNDKIGPFHGGYRETSKSKMINPKYVSKFWVVPPVEPQQQTISVGVTPFTDGDATCEKDFQCGNNYYLRVDLKGAPALRFLSRNSYYTAMAYTGCCTGETPTPVDPTTVYIQWATALMNSPLISPFLSITVYNTTGGNVGTYNKTTYDAAVQAGKLDPADRPTWETYTPVPGAAGLTAGMYIQGAYVDTQFGDCTFYPNDSIIAFLEPIKIYASEVDFNGDPCAFTGLCVVNTCDSRQSQGYGESVARELILTQAYNQAPMYTGRDLRIREITQGDQLVNTVIDRAAQYWRYYIQHSVPRFNNPSGTFDNDQYLLEIITSAENTTFSNAVTGWLEGAGNDCAQLYTVPSAADCTEVIPQPTEPNPGALTPRAQP